MREKADIEELAKMDKKILFFAFSMDSLLEL